MYDQVSPAPEFGWIFKLVQTKQPYCITATTEVCLHETSTLLCLLIVLWCWTPRYLAHSHLFSNHDKIRKRLFCPIISLSSISHPVLIPTVMTEPSELVFPSLVVVTVNHRWPRDTMQPLNYLSVKNKSSPRFPSTLSENMNMHSELYFHQGQ